MSGAIPSWARVGAKVVCIAPAKLGWRGDVSGRRFGGPKRGDICTITGVLAAPASYGFILALAEYPSPVEKGYIGKFFRPLVTIEDDIATHFAEHLRQPRKIEVDA